MFLGTHSASVVSCQTRIWPLDKFDFGFLPRSLLRLSSPVQSRPFQSSPMSLPGSLLSFGAGALLGMGIATAATSIRHRLSPPNNTPVPVTAIPSAVVPKAHVSGLVPALAGPLAPLVPVSTGDVLHRLAYSTAYDRRLRHPAWTLEHLTPQSLARAPLGPADGAGKVDRARSVFTEDEAVPVPFRARSQDYFQSGYDRGHMFVSFALRSGGCDSFKR